MNVGIANIQVKEHVVHSKTHNLHNNKIEDDENCWIQHTVLKDASGTGNTVEPEWQAPYEN